MVSCRYSITLQGKYIHKSNSGPAAKGVALDGAQDEGFGTRDRRHREIFARGEKIERARLGARRAALEHDLDVAFFFSETSHFGHDIPTDAKDRFPIAHTKAREAGNVFKERPRHVGEGKCCIRLA